MRVTRLILLSFLLMLATGAAAVAQAEVTTLRSGEGDGGNVAFVFDENAKPAAIILRTMRIGVTGSRILLTVDDIKKPVFTHIFAPGECKFTDNGSSCEVTISADEATYRAILADFRHGHVARVTVQDAGVKRVSRKVPLGGFAKALR